MATKKLTPPWPDNCRGAISLTFDDGAPSQLTGAVPLLNDAGIAATFYLVSKGDDYLKKLEPWRAVRKAGHEIGNHSVNHICSRAFKDEPDARGLENMTLAEIEYEIAEGKRRLQEIAPDQVESSFCYPCYFDHVGCGPTRQSFVPVVAKHHIAARAKGEFPFANPAATADLHYLWSWPAERMAASQMMGLVEQCMGKGHWGIFTFHGIQQGHLSVGDGDLREFIKYLKDARERVWAAPVVKVAQRIISWRKENGI